MKKRLLSLLVVSLLTLPFLAVTGASTVETQAQTMPGWYWDTRAGTWFWGPTGVVPAVPLAGWHWDATNSLWIWGIPTTNGRWDPISYGTMYPGHPGSWYGAWNWDTTPSLEWGLYGRPWQSGHPAYTLSPR